MNLQDITFDAGTQVRAAINDALVTEYAYLMTAGVQFPPLVVFHDGTRHYLADGFHRFLAAQRNALADFSVDVRPGTKDDALWFALGANRKNGHRMTSGDLRHAITLAFQTWPDRSANEVAAQVGCTQQYVSGIRVQVTSSCNLADRVTGKDGKSYPATKLSSQDKRELIKDMLADGAGTGAIIQAVGVSKTTVVTVKRELELPVRPRQSMTPAEKTKAGKAQRYDRMRELAAEGYSSRQIAAAVGLSDEGCRATMRREGIAAPADKVIGKSRRHDANRIVERIVLDAENIIEGVQLIDFAGIDRTRLVDWLASLQASRDKLGMFIRRLMKEQQNNGQAA